MRGCQGEEPRFYPLTASKTWFCAAIITRKEFPAIFAGNSCQIIGKENTHMDTTKHVQMDWNSKEQLKFDDVLTQHPVMHRAQPYFRSKAFVSQIGINPLIAAAAPLFFLVEKVQHSHSAPDLIKLHEDFVHEIKAFDNQAQTHGYKSNIFLAAHLVLCLWIDEIILSTPWGRESNWETGALVLSQSGEGKSFFAVLNHCLNDIPTYIDLLELMYVCVSLGYEGEYRYLERGHILLTEIRDNLFHCIQRQRGEVSKKLEIISTAISAPALPQQKIISGVLLRIIILLVILIALATCYFSMNKQLNNNFYSTYSALQQLANAGGS